MRLLSLYPTRGQRLLSRPMTLPDSTPWAGGAASSPAPAGRDEAYEAWKRADDRHTGVMARHAFNAAWAACLEREQARIGRLGLNVLRSRRERDRIRGELARMIARLERAGVIGARVTLEEVIQQLNDIKDGTA
jgi:hypothetical protein